MMYYVFWRILGAKAKGRSCGPEVFWGMSFKDLDNKGGNQKQTLLVALSDPEL